MTTVIPLVGVNGNGVATGTSFTLDLTALTGGSGSTPLEGDVAICVTGWSSTLTNEASSSGVSSGGWTWIADLGSDDNYAASYSVWYKKMGATPDTSVTCISSATYGGAGLVAVYRGVDPYVQLDVTTTVASGINTANADCPANTPVTTGALVLAVAGFGRNISYSWVGVPPTGYGDCFGQATDGGGGRCSVVGISSKDWSGSGAEDPGVYTGIGTASFQCWAGATIVLRPTSTIIANMTIPDVPVGRPTFDVQQLWVLPSDVKSGITYGPTGTEFEGTYSAGGGGGGVSRGRITNA